MKKLFKTLLAAFLAGVMAFGSLSAFALNAGEYVSWRFKSDDYDYSLDYFYAGELNEGKNTVTHVTEDHSQCYSFNAPQSGYYRCSSSNSIDYFISDTVVDGEPMNYAYTVFSYSAGTDTCIVYFDKGVSYICVEGFYFDDEPAEMTVEYLGSEITDITFDDKNFTEMITDYDYWLYEENSIGTLADITLIFSNGKTASVNNAYIYGKASSPIAEGENDVTFEIFGIEKQVTVICRPITDYIEKVEISNLDKYLYVRRYYYPNDYSYDFYSLDGKGLEGETITVTLSDGTTQSIVIDWDGKCVVTLPNGKEVRGFFGDNTKDDEKWFVLEIADHKFIERKCESVSATDEENLARLKQRVGYTIDWMGGDIQNWIDEINNPESEYTCFESVFRMIKDIFSRIGAVFGEASACFEFILFN